MPIPGNDTTNEMFQMALDLVNNSSRNIFLTGRAGTGKTTFLKYIRETSPKQKAIVAPTGVAAINAGGVTIHSFFQLPITIYLPDSENSDQVTTRHDLISRLRFTDEKKKLLQALELLVIDEISMVRCDTLDAIDAVLRYVRHKPLLPFGGVQVLFIGDMLQLPPVVRDHEWSILSGHYASPYFFDSKVIREEGPVYIEFNKIYRQTEREFIGLLNQVRNNDMDEEGMRLLESRFQPDSRRKKQDGFIILTTHNGKARDTNAAELKKLDTELYSFPAEVDGSFQERDYPADEILQLKKGAQVMFIRNDTDRNRRYFNGKIGIVLTLEKDRVLVKCENEDEPIVVKKESWENIRYSFNSTTRQLQTEVLGTFSQYPLRLAWAITIHKSQGLTFEKAIIDAGSAFAPGQVYVALSRCTTLNGVILESRIRSSSLAIDDRILEFTRSKVSVYQLQQELNDSRKVYLEATLRNLFDFEQILNFATKAFKDLDNEELDTSSEISFSVQSFLSGMEGLQKTAIKFGKELDTLFSQGDTIDTSQLLRQRLKAAASYFVSHVDRLIIQLKESPAIVEGCVRSAKFAVIIKEVYAQLMSSQFSLSYQGDWLQMESYFQYRKDFRLKPLTINRPKPKFPNVRLDLYERLRSLRESLAMKKNVPGYLIANNRTLEELTRYLPHTIDELGKIIGFGKARLSAYGNYFIEVIEQYAGENGLVSIIDEKITKAKPIKTRPGVMDTKSESYKLYERGLSIDDIAKERQLTPQTIESHLSFYISQGSIAIDKLISKDKQQLIESALEGFDGGSITPIKVRLGATISYGEIRMVLAWRSFQTANSYR